jgi:feruloyl esterase
MVGALLAFAAPAFAQQPCESLGSIDLPFTKLVAEVRTAAAYEGPSPLGRATGANVPGVCEVHGTIARSSGSAVKFVVWLPVTDWNGKYRQEGNSGWAGVIPYWNLIDPVRRGYAAAATDNGHEAPPGVSTAAAALRNRETLADFGYLAVHDTSVRAKALIAAYYGRPPSHSYFVGCSEGGREALMSAQRYPDDFRGILAAAPSASFTGVMTAFAWNQRALRATPGSYIPPAMLPVIQRAVLGACDALDGIADGLLENPRACRFDPAVLTCGANTGPDCLTASQVGALRAIYAGPTNPRTGEQLFPGLPPGHEGTPRTWAGWMITDPLSNALQFAHAKAFFGELVSTRPDWEPGALDFDADAGAARTLIGPVLDATSPDLRGFRAAGGKLLQYHGWGDAAVSPLASIAYYEAVRAQIGVDDYYRLFMVPGMGHCGGVAGPAYFGNVGLGDPRALRDPERDVFSALEAWVERGTPPERLIGSGTVGDVSTPLTRPICPYPTEAHYKGQGDIHNADNFDCRAPALTNTQRVTVTNTLPFPTGHFAGTGSWVSEGAEGAYRVTYVITSEANGAMTHVVTRVFLKSDGSIESEENTTVTFSRTSGNRIHVALAVGKTVIEGEGYCLGDQCHYEATIAPGHRLEFAFYVTPVGLIGLGSSMNNGKFMSCRETLATATEPPQ